MSLAASRKDPPPAFLSGGGDMGERIRAHDWGASPLGEPGSWPQPLKTLVTLMLSSKQPMFIAWGAEQTWLYNDAFTPILGAKHPAALGRPALGEVWSEAREVLAPLFERVFGGEPVHMDDFGLMLDRHGRLEEAHFAFAYTPVRDDTGSVAGLFGACIEMTEVLRTQRALRESEARLREADRRKDEFLATLAHELRNPLAPLRNALYLARARAAADGASHSEVLHAMMERQVNQMVRLVDDLLDVARITQGKIAVRPEPIEIARVVASAVETTAPTVKQAGHEIAVSLPPFAIHVEGDAVRLTQVLSNLINNAVKFSSPGPPIELAVEREGGEVVLAVRDHGMGIPADKLEVVFEMFSQLDRSLERSKSGLGLGLALARQIVTMHGGTIRASSAGAGQGSEFTVRLPILVPLVPAKSVAPAARTGTVRRRILVADDNHDAADSMAMLLRDTGHEVEVVYDGARALDAARRMRPDVFILDIGMPGLNGYDLARAARREPWSADTLIVALTGWGQESDRQRAGEAGIDVHLVKPVERDMLEIAVLRRREALTTGVATPR